MSEIHSFLKEKEKREKNRIDYRDKIRRHRLGGALRVILIFLVIGILITLVVVQSKNHYYTSYTEISSAERNAVSGSVDVRLGNTILTYSRDGAHCTNHKGEVLWNQTYEIQDVLLDVCRDVAVIASYNGRDVYVVSSEGILGNFTTNLPIRSVTVSASNGNELPKVVVVMADTGVTYYNTYSAEGEQLYVGEATMAGSGYPMSISLSPNGELMQISYIYLDAGIQKTKIAFYNLGAVGANNSDFLVSVNECRDTLVPYVRFINNETAFAVGDNVLMIYKGSQKPALQAQFMYDKKVKSVFYGEDYVGLVFYSDTGASLYEMNVYSADAKRVGTFYFDIEYTDIIFEKDAFMVYNDAECQIIMMNGEEKYKGTFEKPVKTVLPLKNAYRYLLATEDSLDVIQLR